MILLRHRNETRVFKHLSLQFLLKLESVSCFRCEVLCTSRSNYHFVLQIFLPAPPSNVYLVSGVAGTPASI